MSEDEIAALISFLAVNPKAGDVMAGTGGARKVRWRRPGTGKSGGYRIITAYIGADMPVLLLNVFTKGDRDNLSVAERNALTAMLRRLIDIYRKGLRQ